MTINVEDFYDVNFSMVWDVFCSVIDVGPDTSKA